MCKSFVGRRWVDWFLKFLVCSICLCTYLWPLSNCFEYYYRKSVLKYGIVILSLLILYMLFLFSPLPLYVFSCETNYTNVVFLTCIFWWLARSFRLPKWNDSFALLSLMNRWSILNNILWILIVFHVSSLILNFWSFIVEMFT